MKKVIFLTLVFTMFNSSHAIDIKEFHNQELNANYRSLFNFLSEEKTSCTSQDFSYKIKKIDLENKVLALEGGSEWSIGGRYQAAIQSWKPNDRVKIFSHSYYPTNNIEIQNIENGVTAWGELKKQPTNPISIRKVSNSNITLSNGFILESTTLWGKYMTSWSQGDNIFIFHTKDEKSFDLWNLDLNQLVCSWELIKNEKEILKLEEILKSQVIAQDGAVKLVAAPLLNYTAGLHDPNKPISVFLFLGPTGVGKTELAKVLTKEYYGNSNRMLRFDMSHFAERYTISRLIGSSPGYVDSWEGGQLTEPLKKSPRYLVLLDEIEKAHDSVRKFFLPVFDEGCLRDAFNNYVDCRDVIFIMTSNLCGKEISAMFQNGYTSQEILEMIEPKLMQSLSPELYNRVQPIIFQPIERSAMKRLVELLLSDVVKRVENKTNVLVTIEQSVKDYLIEHGFHPDLGARPLKKLIDKVVVANIAYAIINEEIPKGSSMVLRYLAQEDAWIVNWE